MKARIDDALCIGCALCPEICPEVFKMDGAKAVVYATSIDKALEKKCKQAAEDCPVTAITIEE